MSEKSPSEDARGRRASLACGPHGATLTKRHMEGKGGAQALGRGEIGEESRGPASSVKGLDLILQVTWARERMAIPFLSASLSATSETRGSISEKKCEVVKYYPITA